MGCDSQLGFGSVGHFRAILGRAAEARVPMSGSFDITYRCNFRCSHCYVGHLTGRHISQAQELSTAGVVHLLQQAADAGCLFVVLSGGEPLLRKDFVDIYLAAKRLGMIVTLFTNASLVNERLLGVFEEYPPHEVEVSVYGATERTYERVTGVPGSFAKVRSAIDLMLDRGIHVRAKTMILRDNADEIGALDRLAHELGIGFRVDPLISPRLDGDPCPLEQRVDPERAVEIEADVTGLLESLRHFLDEHVPGCTTGDGPDAATGGHRVYLCGAGKASFHVDPEGWIRPCQMSAVAFDSTTTGFEAAWKAVVSSIDEMKWEGTGGCADCPNIMLCGYCPGLFALENASPARPPEYVCRLGQGRYSRIARERLEISGVRVE